MNEEELKEISFYWSKEGDSEEIDDIVSLREIACTDIHELIKVIKEQQKKIEWMYETFADI